MTNDNMLICWYQDHIITILHIYICDSEGKGWNLSGLQLSKIELPRMKFTIRNLKDKASFRRVYKYITIAFTAVYIIVPMFGLVAIPLGFGYDLPMFNCFAYWCFFTLPCLEFCFALYAWITSKHSIGSNIWIEKDAGKVRWKGFRYSVL